MFAVIIADRFFPSSKLCPMCGHKKDKLPLSDRIYQCDNHDCDWVAHRDYSAAINLLGLAEARFYACGEARADSLRRSRN